MTEIKIVPVGDLPAGYQFATTDGAPVEVVEEVVNKNSDHHNSDHHRRSDHRRHR